MAGFLYLAVMLDVFSRRIVGWCMRDTLQVSIVLDALNMAATQRRATDVIRHSDQGSQDRAFALGQRCKLWGVRPSMGSHGDAYDSAMAESFVATLEVECLASYGFATHTEARLTIFRYTEGWYNPHRRHSAFGQQSPVAFQQAHAVQSITAKKPNPTGSTEAGEGQFRRQEVSLWAHPTQNEVLADEPAQTRDER